VLHHQSIALALLAGLAPVLPLLLTVAVLLVIYTAVSLLAVTVITVRIVCTNDDATECLRSLFMLIINAPIAIMTLTPLKLTKRDSKVSGQAHLPVPLPAGAPGDERKQGTPFYWQLRREMPLPNGDASQIVMPDGLFEIPVRGRHARPETVEPRPGSEECELPMAA
jgi:hypothetical protein